MNLHVQHPLSLQVFQGWDDLARSRVYSGGPIQNSCPISVYGSSEHNQVY